MSFGSQYPSIAADAIDKVWHTQRDGSQIMMDGRLTAFGQPPKEWAKKAADEYESARKAGYEQKIFRHSRLGNVRLMVKDGKALTPAGATIKTLPCATAGDNSAAFSPAATVTR